MKCIQIPQFFFLMQTYFRKLYFFSNYPITDYAVQAIERFSWSEANEIFCFSIRRKLHREYYHYRWKLSYSAERRDRRQIVIVDYNRSVLSSAATFRTCLHSSFSLFSPLTFLSAKRKLQPFHLEWRKCNKVQLKRKDLMRGRVEGIQSFRAMWPELQLQSDITRNVASSDSIFALRFLDIVSLCCFLIFKRYRYIYLLGIECHN